MKVYRKYKATLNDHYCCQNNALMWPLSYRSRLELVDDTQEAFLHVPLRTSALEPQSVAIESLNRSKALETKSRYTTRNPNLTAPWRRQESIQELHRLRPDERIRGRWKPRRQTRRKSTAIHPRAAPARTRNTNVNY
uniref:Uncharacterized protein n=1 Tax=Aegilops tauschii subsp. strangulata TaxID=200361 RepID=A0A453MX33_AEGTS